MTDEHVEQFDVQFTFGAGATYTAAEEVPSEEVSSEEVPSEDVPLEKALSEEPLSKEASSVDSSSEEASSDNVSSEDELDESEGVDSDVDQLKSKSDQKKKKKKKSRAFSSFVPIGSIKDFYGEDDATPKKARSWLKTFNYVEATANWSHQQKLHAFYVHMRGSASFWFHQLDFQTKKSWKRLKRAFKKRYCKRESVGAKFRYHNAVRRLSETPRMYLDRLNSLAKEAGVGYRPGEGEAGDHVTHFIISVQDEELSHSLLMADIVDVRELSLP